jgi:hypothetical protein
VSGLDAMHDPPAWWADAACEHTVINGAPFIRKAP